MVYIYGGQYCGFNYLKGKYQLTLLGGYVIGQIYDDFYTPDQLVLDSISSGTPVIYVAMNYRVGSRLPRKRRLPFLPQLKQS